MIINDPKKSFYPYRPSLAGYDKSYKNKYDIRDFNKAIKHDDWETSFNASTKTDPNADILLVDCIYYPGVYEGTAPHLINNPGRKAYVIY